MCFLVHLLGVDPSLGRVDYASFTDQTLMELLYEGFDEETKQRYKTIEGIYIHLWLWECLHDDGHGRVVRIKDCGHEIGGSLQLSFLPPKVREVNISMNRLAPLTWLICRKTCAVSG